MKKMSLILSMVVISAMLLAACGGAANNANGNGTPDAGAGNNGSTMPTSELGTTPGAGDTGTGTLDGTPTVETGGEAGGTDATPTTDAGSAVDTTPTAEVGSGSGTTDTTPTAEAGTGSGTDSTPQAGIGEMSNFALLSDLLQVSVNSADGQQVGSVAGVVINRPIAATSSTSGTDSSSGTTGSGADAQATPTVADMGKGTGSGSAGAGSTGSDTMASGDSPSIDYVLVNVTDGAGSDTSGSGTGTGSSSGSTDATPTADTGAGAGSGLAGSEPSGNVVAVPFEAFRTQTGEAAAGTDNGSQFNALVIDMDAAALAGAPAFTDESALAQGWDSEAQAYWSGQGLSIPATGPAEAEGEPVVIRDSVGTMNVTSQDGQSFGQVTDFVVDLTTGELAYAILSGAGTSTGSFYAVPVSNFNWGAGTDASMGGTGAFSANFPQTAFDSAPSFTSLDELDFSADWNSEIDTYWQSAGGNNQ